VAILVFDGVEQLDFTGPFEVFSRTRLSPGVESRRSQSRVSVSRCQRVRPLGLVGDAYTKKWPNHESGLKTCGSEDSAAARS
jgi:putative intracellular protease/amidase